MLNIKGLTISSPGGTSLVGYLDCSFDDLVMVFGPPHEYDPDTDDKVKCQWTFRYKGNKFTIYDYKSYRHPQSNYDWHIGSVDGFNARKNIREIMSMAGIHARIVA